MLILSSVRRIRTLTNAWMILKQVMIRENKLSVRRRNFLKSLVPSVFCSSSYQLMNLLKLSSMFSQNSRS